MLKELRDYIVDYLQSQAADGYPATIAKYHDELFRIEDSVLNLPAVLVKTNAGTFDFREKYIHTVDLICIDINDAGRVSQMEAVEDLVDWVLENLPADYAMGSDWKSYLTGEGEYRFMLVREPGREPLVIGLITLRIGAEA